MSSNDQNSVIRPRAKRPARNASQSRPSSPTPEPRPLDWPMPPRCRISPTATASVYLIVTPDPVGTNVLTFNRREGFFMKYGDGDFAAADDAGGRKSPAYWRANPCFCARTNHKAPSAVTNRRGDPDILEASKPGKALEWMWLKGIIMQKAAFVRHWGRNDRGLTMWTRFHHPKADGLGAAFAKVFSNRSDIEGWTSFS